MFLKRLKGRTLLVGVVRSLCLVVSLVPRCGFAGYTAIAYKGTSPKGTYDVEVTLHAGPSERYSQWLMDVSRNGTSFLSDYKIRPFYALTCVNDGKSRWLSDSVLHFLSYGAGQGRVVAVTVCNNTDKAVPLTEVWIRSVDQYGYSHCPSICLLFDVPAGSARMINPGPLVFAGGEYFLVGCEQDLGESMMSYFRIPKPVSAHPPYLPFVNQHIIINLTSDGPVIESTGGLETLTEQAARNLVPQEVFLPLVEERSENRKNDAEHNKPEAGKDR